MLCKDPVNLLLGQEAPKPVGIPIQGVEAWEVQDILASKIICCKLVYRTSWVSHDLDPTWYPAENFAGALHKIKAFHDKYLN